MYQARGWGARACRCVSPSDRAAEWRYSEFRHLRSRNGGAEALISIVSPEFPCGISRISLRNFPEFAKQINGIMSNASFSMKMNMLKQPWKYDNNVKHVPTFLQEFVAQYGEADWDEQTIRKRTADLARRVHEVAATKNAYG